MSKDKPSPKQVLRSIPYGKVKSLIEPITQKEMGSISKKDLCRLLYITNSELFRVKNELSKPEKSL